MIDSKKLTDVFERVREKLTTTGHVDRARLKSRRAVIKLIEVLMGPCPPGEEIAFLRAYVARDVTTYRTAISKRPYKLPIGMRIAAQKCASLPVPLSMSSKVSDAYISEVESHDSK